MAKNRKITLEIPLYFGRLIIHQCRNLQKLGLKYGYDLHGKEAVMFDTPHESGYKIYRIAFTYDANPRIIAHEALHATNHIFRDRGIDADTNNDEPQCYLHGWIVGECHKFLKVKKQK